MFFKHYFFLLILLLIYTNFLINGVIIKKNYFCNGFTLAIRKWEGKNTSEALFSIWKGIKRILWNDNIAWVQIPRWDKPFFNWKVSTMRFSCHIHTLMYTESSRKERGRILRDREGLRD